MPAPRILFACPKQESPSGGTRVLYHYVDILNRRGLPAFVWHQEKGYRYQWYPVRVPTLYGKDLAANANDLLVVPEIYGRYIPHMMPGVPKVIINQHCFETFGLGYTWATTEVTSPYRDCLDVKAVVVTSDETAKYLRYAFPNVKLLQVPQAVDPSLFAYSEKKKKQICFLPRKNPQDATQVLSLLRVRGALTGYEVVPVEGAVYADYAKYLRDALFFLSFGFPEGFGMPPLEAMSSGCVVVGYHGVGGREFFTSQYGFPIEQGDTLAFARTVEELITKAETNPSCLDAIRLRASQMAREKYAPQVEEDGLVASFNEVLGLLR